MANESQDLIEDLRRLIPNLITCPIMSLLQHFWMVRLNGRDSCLLCLVDQLLHLAGLTIPEGGVPLAENATVRNLIGSTQEIDRLQNYGMKEKLVAHSFGIRNLPSLNATIRISMREQLKDSGSRINSKMKSIMQRGSQIWCYWFTYSINFCRRVSWY